MSIGCLPLELPPTVGQRVPIRALGIGIVRVLGKRTTRVSARVCNGRHWHRQPPRLLRLLYLRPKVTRDDKSREQNQVLRQYFHIFRQNTVQ